MWSQIINAAKHPGVGWKMSSTKIISLLKRQNPQSFAGLARSTVDGWIDRSGDEPKWSEKALKMAEYGHDQGQGNKGGRKGIFVCLFQI